MGALNPFGSDSGGGGKQKTGIVIEPQQARLNAAQAGVADEQLRNIQAQGQFQHEQFSQLPGAVEAQLAEGDRALSFADEQQAIGRGHQEFQQGIIDRGSLASPEQQALIEERSRAALDVGTSDIRSATTDNLEILREELTGSLGLSPRDTPILDRGARIAKEGVRQEGNLINTIRGQQAGLELDAGFQQSGLVSNQQGIAEQTRQFQEQLRQQAFSNRLALTNQVGSQGLALSSLSVPFSTPTAIAEQHTKFSQKAGFGEVAGGIGAIMQGVGSIIPG